MSSDDIMPPAEIPSIGREDDQPGAGQLMIKTMNLNMGAVQVAKKRSLPAVLDQIDQLAQVFGSKWEYGIPFKKKNKATGKTDTQIVKGATVGCSEAVARCYGNCTTGVVDVTEVGNSWVFSGVFIDIESGFQLIRPFRQRRSANIGGYGGDSDRAEDIMFQIGASKATRNVITNAIGDLVDRALEQARTALTARIERSRPDVQSRVLARLEEYGIPVKRVTSFYRRTSLDDLSAGELAQVVKSLQAVQEGNVKPDELWGDDIPSTTREEMRQGMHHTVERTNGGGTPQAQDAPERQGRSAAEAAADVVAAAGTPNRGRDPQTVSTSPPDEDAGWSLEVAGRQYRKPGWAAKALAELAQKAQTKAEFLHRYQTELAALPKENLATVMAALADKPEGELQNDEVRTTVDPEVGTIAADAGQNSSLFEATVGGTTYRSAKEAAGALVRHLEESDNPDGLMREYDAVIAVLDEPEYDRVEQAHIARVQALNSQNEEVRVNPRAEQSSLGLGGDDDQDTGAATRW